MLRTFYERDLGLVSLGEQGSDRLCTRNWGDGCLPRQSWDEPVCEKPLMEASWQGFALGETWLWTEWGRLPSDCTGFPGVTSGAARPPSAQLRSPSGYPVPGEPRSPAGLTVLIPRTDRFSLGRTTAQSGGTIRASLTISPQILGLEGS